MGAKRLRGGWLDDSTGDRLEHPARRRAKSLRSTTRCRARCRGEQHCFLCFPARILLNSTHDRNLSRVRQRRLRPIALRVEAAHPHSSPQGRSLRQRRADPPLLEHRPRHLEQTKRSWLGCARIIDRLAADLRRDFPEMTGLSSRNLKYMRAFAEAFPEREIVQQVVARLPWGMPSNSSSAQRAASNGLVCLTKASANALRASS